MMYDMDMDIPSVSQRSFWAYSEWHAFEESEVYTENCSMSQSWIDEELLDPVRYIWLLQFLISFNKFIKKIP